MGPGEENFVHFREGEFWVVDGGGGFWDALLLCFWSSSGRCRIGVFFAGIFNGLYVMGIGRGVSCCVTV